MLTALALAAVVETCDWSQPGRDRYTGSIEAAIDRYKLEPERAARLKAMVDKHEYTEQVVIRRDSIDGKAQYSDLRSMHFGAGRVCKSPDRSKWKDGFAVNALVYCDGDLCVAVPEACGNASLVTRTERKAEVVAPPAVAEVAPDPVPWLPPVEDRSFTVSDAQEPAHVFPGYGSDAPVFGPIWTSVAVIAAPCVVCEIPCVPAVPEPETYALMLAGLVCVGALRKAKRG